MKLLPYIFGAIALTAVASVQVFGATTLTIQDIETAQTAYFAAHGTYYQVLPNNTKPPYLADDPQTALGGRLPTNMRIDTYKQADGQQGYWITTETATAITSVGYGPQAAEHTGTTLKGSYQDYRTRTKQ